ncbi:MAG: hypothetical protein JW749_08580 [Sedimentisphaerales bacterium]|nr:hypothetical protein [Sedimentisphaerales bacterium]
MLDFVFGKLIGADRNPGDIIDTISEIAPFIIFAAIWLFAAIAKTVKSAQKGQQGGQTPKKEKPQPNFNDFVRIIKDRYAEAKKAAEQRSADSQQPPFREHPSPVPVNKPQVSPVYEVTIPYSLPRPEEIQPDKSPVVKPTPPALEYEHPAEPAILTELIETHPNPYIAEITEQLAHSDGLRKVVLYSEIFGTPVGLRD